jgi:amino acid adenylation domain-containing protein
VPTGLQQRIASLSPEKRALFEKKLAESSTARYQSAPIKHIPSSEPVPSFGQEIFWAIEQMASGTAQFNECFSLRLKGDVNVAALKTALTALVDRHETLRTRYIKSADGLLQLEFSETGEFPLPVSDFSGMETSRKQEALSTAMHAEANRPVDLSTGPILRAVLYRLEPHQHELQLIMHHVAVDGWSLGVFFRDLAAFYNAAATGAAAQLPKLPITFSDYARWQREQMAGAEGQRLLSYWEKEIKGSSYSLELPTDRPRPPMQTFNGAVTRYPVAASLASDLQAFCLRERVTPFMAALAALYAVFARYTGQSDFLIGSPIAARSRIESEDLLGYFANLVALRGNLQGDPTFRELLQRVRQTALDAYAHQELPLEKVLRTIHAERDPGRSAIYQAMLVYQSSPIRKIELHGLETSLSQVRTDTSKVDITIELTPSGEALDALIEYNTDLFDSETIDRLWGHLTTYLERAIAAPEQRVAAISLLTPGKRQQLLTEWNDTEREYRGVTSVSELVEAQVERTPDAIAVIDGDQRLSYRELNSLANQLARELRNHGAGRDRLIGLCTERSPAMIVAMLAIAKAGAAYVPLDPMLPVERLRYMVEDSGLRVLVTESSLLRKLPTVAGATILLDERAWTANAPDNPAVHGEPEDLAYVIYTSGSTGKPKGVEIPRRALTNFLCSMREWLEMSEHDRLLAVTTISFDIAGLEIWLPLVVGAEIVVAGRDAAIDGYALRELLERHDITFMQATPVTWRILFEAGWRGKPDLHAVCGGEAMPPEVASKLAPAVKCLWNLYGPTETTIWSTGCKVTDAGAPVLIGRPIANTQCYILDEHLQPVPIGVTGELYIGGDGLARGYLNLPELTAEKFLTDPFRGGDARMFRTGDLARYRTNGNIECLGRIDHQIKIRGHRIELGEIEAALQEEPEIEQAVAITREGLPGEMWLVTCVVARAGRKLDVAELKTRLRMRLPDYMVPAAIEFLEAIPRLPNGKINRAALISKPQPDAARSEELDSPRSPLEKALTEIWAEVLGLPEVGIHENFFELGGTSLIAVRLFARVLSLVSEFQPSLALLLKAPTVEEFACTSARRERSPALLLCSWRRGQRPQHARSGDGHVARSAILLPAGPRPRRPYSTVFNRGGNCGNLCR